MCKVLGEHWGYAKNDFDYKSVAYITESLVVSCRYRSNFLLDVGPKGDGSLRTIDKGILEMVGERVNLNEKALRLPLPTNIEIIGKTICMLVR